MKALITIFLIVAVPFLTIAQNEWELKKNKEGIKVYTRNIDQSSLKEVKVTCTLQAKLSQLTALLLDAEAHEEWVYNTKNSYLVRQVYPNQQLYYTEIGLPWPMANREVVVQMKIEQHPVSKVMQVEIVNADTDIPLQKGGMRVAASRVNWVVTPLSGNRLSVQYIGQADPGGNVPAWVVNAFTTKGPFETFRKLKTIVSSPDYANASYDFIKE